MKLKTAELEGELLDKAVLKAMGRKVRDRYPPILQDTYGADGWNFPVSSMWRGSDGDSAKTPFRPTEWWDHGGPIIERERVSLIYDFHGAKEWTGAVEIEFMHGDICGAKSQQGGPTPLIAAMRAFVASKLGDEVELP